MQTLRRFLLLHALWTLAITLLIVPISLTTADDLTLTQHLRWFGHAITLAAFPAGLMVGPQAFSGPDVWRKLGLLAVAEAGLMVLVLLVLGFGAPPPDAPNVFVLVERLRAYEVGSWQRWNQMAWAVYMTMVEVVAVPIYAGLGLMLGAWGKQVLPTAFRRILFWAMTLKLVGFSYLVTDNLYEQVVNLTAGPAAMLAFVILLIPLGMYGGLLLPSIALALRARNA
jgi:hypothetical protein